MDFVVDEECCELALFVEVLVEYFSYGVGDEGVDVFWVEGEEE